MMKSMMKAVVFAAAPLVLCAAEAAGETHPATQPATAPATQPTLVAQSNEPLVIPDGTSREHPGLEVNQGNPPIWGVRQGMGIQGDSVFGSRA